MIPLHLAELARLAGGVVGAGDALVTEPVAVDSREVVPGGLFAAVRGERVDGHDFVERAFGRGASGAVVSRSVEGPHVLVRDTAAALAALGTAARARTNARIAGVTGSVGKTGTKEALAAALARAPGTAVHRSVKSYNNHTGVPLSLARMPTASAYGVFELGMNHAGEIARLTTQVRPHVALVTAIAPVHIEFFDDGLDGIVDAKGEIFAGLEPGGTAIVPFDTPYRDRLIALAAPHAATVLTFGVSDGADVRARDVIEHASGSSLTALLPGGELTLTVGQPGAHWVSNALAVLAAVHALGADVGLAALALADMKPLTGRGARATFPVGTGTALVIDESYNANPASMRATLAVLAREEGRHVAVLGMMGELGESSDALHAGLADDVIAADVKVALLVGAPMAALAEALERRTRVRHVADAAAAEAALAGIVAAGDCILVKGSNSVGLAALVASLTKGA